MGHEFLGLGKKAKAKRLAKKSANQLYKEEVERTGKKRPFKAWLQEAKDTGLIKTLIDTATKKVEAEQIEIDFYEDKPKKMPVKIFGMNPIVSYGIMAILAYSIGYGIYKWVKK